VGWVTQERFRFPLTLFVSVEQVRLALGCSRSAAYEHLRRAARRLPGTRGLLRVPLRVWEGYVAEVFACGSPSEARSGTPTSTRAATASSAPPTATTAGPPRPALGSSSATPPIPPTQPRPRRP